MLEPNGISDLVNYIICRILKDITSNNIFTTFRAGRDNIDRRAKQLFHFFNITFGILG